MSGSAQFIAGNFAGTGKARILWFASVADARAAPNLFAIADAVEIKDAGIFYADAASVVADDGINAFQVTGVNPGRFIFSPGVILVNGIPTRSVELPGESVSNVGGIALVDIGNDSYPFASDQLLRVRAEYQTGIDGAALTRVDGDGANPVIYGANPTLSLSGFAQKKGIRFGYTPQSALKQALPAQFSTERPFTIFAYLELGDLGDNASRFLFGLSNGANRMIFFSGNSGTNNYWNIVGASGTNDVPTNQIVSAATGVCQGRRTRKSERVFVGLRYDGNVFQGIWNGSLIVKSAGYVSVPRTCGTVANDGYFYFNGAPGLDAYNGNPLLREYLILNRAATAPEISQYWRAIASEYETVVDCYGDSLVWGTGATTDATLGTLNGWPQALNIYGRIVQNWGKPATTTYMTEYAIELSSPKVPKRSGASSIAVIAAGANDIILGGSTAAQIYANLLICVANAKKVGHGTVYLCTVLRSSSFGGYAVLNALNALILAGATANGYSVSDVSALAEFQDPTNVTYFTDGLHLTTAGYAIYAAKIDSDLP